MRLRTKFLLFVIIIHLTALVLSFLIFRDNKIFFIASEVLIIISVIICWQLYNQLLQPLNMLMQGTEAIKDRDFNVKFVETGKYEVDELIKVYNEMIDELRTERTKQEQQHFFLEKLIQTSPTGIMILDYDNNIQQVNPKAEDLLGLTEKELKGKAVDAVDHPVMQHILPLKSGESKTITLNGVTTYKLQKSHFIDRGFPRHFIMMEELTAEILAAEKKAYGKVIRMMAHEVNNTIGPVNSILQSTIKNQSIWQNKASETLHHALEVAVERNQNLNIFMRNFANVVRLPGPVKKSVDLVKLIHSVATLMQMRAGEKQVEFIYDLPSAPFLIHADEQQLEQAFINIVKNAIEAIETTGRISFALDPKARQLIITDNGKGIAGEASAQIFSPFFSTKKDGQGIGLTLVREILSNHGYDFSLKTNPGGLTAFTIHFGN